LHCHPGATVQLSPQRKLVGGKRVSPILLKCCVLGGEVLHQHHGDTEGTEDWRRREEEAKSPHPALSRKERGLRRRPEMSKNKGNCPRVAVASHARSLPYY